MAKYCTKCGRALQEGELCECQPQKRGIRSLIETVIRKVFEKMGVDNPMQGLLLPQTPVVPDRIQPTDNEVPVKMYQIATLRSRIRGQYARGVLQITNKRLILRADGASFQGYITTNHEFAISDISGVELKKSSRISIFNIFLALCLWGITTSVVSSFFSVTTLPNGILLMMALALAAGCIVPFFLIKKLFWVKQCLLNVAVCSLTAVGELFTRDIVGYMTGVSLNAADAFLFIVSILWFWNLILVCLVPDLVLTIQTTGGTEAITLKRRQFATFFRPAVENSGFSEVLPGKDIDMAIKEVGAILSDIQTLGDMAIEKWKG